MKKIAKLCVIYMVVFFSVFALTGCGERYRALCTKNYQTNINEVTEDFCDIQIDSDTADIIILFAQDGKCKVECFEHKKATHAVAVQDGTLTVELKDARKWYERLGSSYDKVTVYLPEKEYGNLLIKTDTSDVDVLGEFKFGGVSVALSTGDVTLSNVVCEGDIFVKVSTGDVKLADVSCNKFTSTGNTGNITLSNATAVDELKITRSTGNVKLNNCTANNKIFLKTSTGKIKFLNETPAIIENAEIMVKVSTGDSVLNNIKCKSLTSTGNTGNITLTSVIASEKFDIVRSTGNVKFNDCDAGEIYVETDTGNVKGSLLSDKVYIVKTDAGRISVPETTIGGKCKIVTDTGDIEIIVKEIQV